MSQPWIVRGEQSSSLTRIVAMVNASLCTPMKSDCLYGTRIDDVLH